MCIVNEDNNWQCSFTRLVLSALMIALNFCGKLRTEICGSYQYCQSCFEYQRKEQLSIVHMHGKNPTIDGAGIIDPHNQVYGGNLPPIHLYWGLMALRRINEF